MRLNLVSRRDAPTGPYTTIGVCVAPKLVPFIFQSLWLKSQKYWWTDGNEWATARKLIAEQASHMLQDCNRETIHILQATYNLLDTSLRGTLRSATGTGTEADPFIYNPPIPQTVNPETGAYPSALYYAQRANEVADNAWNGTAYADLPSAEGARAVLVEIRDILANADLQDDDTLALLGQILAALGTA